MLCTKSGRLLGAADVVAVTTERQPAGTRRRAAALIRFESAIGLHEDCCVQAEQQRDGAELGALPVLSFR
jgi:hypothetical protein